MNDTERRLSDLLHEAVPEPPASIDLRELADRARLDPAPACRYLIRRWSTPLLAAAAMIGVIAGAAAVALVVRGDDQPTDVPPGGRPSRAELDQARKALANWDRSADGQIPIIPRTEQLGDWEASVGENNKLALTAGVIDAAPELDDRPPPDGTISWENAESRPTAVLSAEDTLESLRAGGNCSGCKPLTVTGATLTTMQVESSNGPAVVPAWRFTLRGTAVQILRAAVAVPKLTPLPHDPYAQTFFQPIRSVALADDRRTLTAIFTGTPWPASKPCGADYTAHVVESATAVAVIIVDHPHEGGGEQACRSVGGDRTATVKLAEPLEGRAVISIQEGLAVPVTTG